MEQEQSIEKRKEKIFNFLKRPEIWVIVFLIIAIILGIYIRSMPMQDHGGNPGLWDVTTNTWTLGPDLDPWLFLRTAESIVENGSVPEIDNMRYSPLGYNNAKETKLLPYLLAYTHYFFNSFGTYPIEFSGAIFPVIMFVLTILSFFLLVREIFIKMGNNKASAISLISTFFMIVIPVFLSRTIAGIPEKESAGFFFMFLTFYLLLKAWRSKNVKTAYLFGLLAGISTALMALIWGGVIYVYVAISLSVFAAFILNKVHKKHLIVYFLWIFFTFAIPLITSERFSIIGTLTSISSGLTFLVLIVLLTNFAIWETKISKIKILNKSRTPKPILSLIISLIIIFILSTLVFGPSFIFNKIKDFHQIMFNPIVGRWNTTVAENRQPYFTEWGGSFGPFIRNIPVLFWMFIVGSLVLFKKTLKHIKPKDSWILTGAYFLLLMGLIFSRYAQDSMFNGDNLASKLLYYGTALLFLCVLSYYYFKYYKNGNKGFEKIRFEYIFLFILFTLTLFATRGAVRLIMVLGPISSIFVGYLVVASIDKFRKTKDETIKMILGIFVVLIIFASLFSFYAFYQTSTAQAYNMVPSYYNQQWQKAMDWVREETPQDAVFGHWWDYGYWVQSIGKRATVLDGGNAITYWNYLMGRYVLTGNNQDDALEFLYNHNTTHLLIDSSDIGKYGAFSSIGSDENYDRYSWVGTFFSNNARTIETANQTILTYDIPRGNNQIGVHPLDEDFIINNTLFPQGSAGIIEIVVPVKTNSDSSRPFDQPYVNMVYQGERTPVQVRYIATDSGLVDFGSGLEATIYIMPMVTQQANGGIQADPIGTAVYLSPRWTNGMLAQIYVLDNPFEKFDNFELVHAEPNPIVQSLNEQGMNFPEFIYFQGIQGPIKIWEITYTGKEQIQDKYIDTDANKYLDWAL